MGAPMAEERKDSTMDVELEELEDTSGKQPTDGPSKQAPPAPPSRALRRRPPGETTMRGLLDELEQQVDDIAVEVKDPAARPAAPPSAPGPRPRVPSKPPPVRVPSQPPPTPPASGARPPAAAAPPPAQRAGLPHAPPKPYAAPPVRPPGRANAPAFPAVEITEEIEIDEAGPGGSVVEVTGPAPTPEAFLEHARALVEACEHELAKNPSPLKSARLHYEMARLYEHPLDDLRRAAAHYQEALSRSPEHVPTIRGARRVLFARKGYQSAVPLFDAEARLTSDPRRKATLYYQKGRVLEDVLGAKEEAKKAYATALELDRSNPAILKAMAQSELATEQWAALARTYEREANAVSKDPKQRAALIVQRARLLERRRGEIDGAIELYETALRLDPDAPGALAALKRLHYSLRRFRDLIRVLELEASHTTDPAVRAMALYRIGRLHAERLGNQNEALTALERALNEAPDDPLVLGELSRSYEAAERWDALVKVLERLVDSATETDERMGMLSRIAEIYEEHLDEGERAIQHYDAALRLSPTYVPALQALGKLYRAQGDFPALVRMYLAEAEAAEDPKRRAAAYARVGEIFEEHLEKPDEAAEHHAKALSQVPGYPASFKALSRLFADAGRWRELVELYERAIDQAPDAHRAITYMMKIGSIFEDALGEHAHAAHVYRRVLELDSDHLGAIHSLQRSTERARRWAELVEAIELEAEKTKEEAQIVALFHRAGEVLDEHLSDRDAALIRFRKALGIDPRYVPALIEPGSHLLPDGTLGRLARHVQAGARADAARARGGRAPAQDGAARGGADRSRRGRRHVLPARPRDRSAPRTDAARPVREAPRTGRVRGAREGARARALRPDRARAPRADGISRRRALRRAARAF